MRVLLPREEGTSADCLNKAGGHGINDVPCKDQIHRIYAKRY